MFEDLFFQIRHITRIIIIIIIIIVVLIIVTIFC